MDTELLKLEAGEIILRTVRKHWFILFTRTLGVVVMAIAPLVLIFGGLTAHYPASMSLDLTLLYRPALFFSAAWVLISWMTLFGIWTDYYLDTWIVTTRRVIAIDQQGFFRRKVASFRLERLQNVTVLISGVIPTLLNFGHIEAETAGNTEAFTIKGVPDPRGIKALIQEYADQVVMPPGNTATAGGATVPL